MIQFLCYDASDNIKIKGAPSLLIVAVAAVGPILLTGEGRTNELRYATNKHCKYNIFFVLVVPQKMPRKINYFFLLVTAASKSRSRKIKKTLKKLTNHNNSKPSTRFFFFGLPFCFDLINKKEESEKVTMTDPTQTQQLAQLLIAAQQSSK